MHTLGAFALAAVIATISIATLPFLGGETTDPPTPAFLTEALSAPLTEAFDTTLAEELGTSRTEAPLTRRAAPGINIQISPTGFGAVSDGRPIARAPKFNVPSEKNHRHSHPDAKPHAHVPDPPNSSISLAAEGAGRGAWERYANGTSRSTEFGRQTIVISKEMIEEFLTVDDHHGLRTWRWRIGARGLTPRVGDDGSVGFLLKHRVIDLYIEPVRIFDARGHDITPTGLRWSLDRSGNSRWLELRLDDSGLPLPYVIDPGIVFRSATGSSNGGGATSVSLTMPASVAANDLLLAQVSVRGTPTITPPAGWTLIRTDTDASVVIRQAIYYRQATSGEPGSYSWSFSASAKAAGGILAYAGVDLTAPIDAHGGATGASGVTTAPSITTTVANTMVVAFFAKATIANNFTVSNEVTMRHKSASSGGTNASNVTTAAGDVTQAGAGATGTKTINSSNCTGREWVGQIVALKVDATPPSPPAQSISESGPDSHASGSTFFYRPAGAGGSFTVTSTTSDGESGVKQVRFPAVSVGMTPTAPVDDTTSPYSQVYTWATGASESGAKTVTAYDGADNTSTGTFMITPDSVAPTGGALTVAGVAATGGGSQSYDDGSGTFTIGVRTDYTETLDATNSGLASSTLTRENGTLSADACSAYGAPATLIGTPVQGPFATGCYRYVLTGTDNVGNAVSVTTVVKVDTSAPGAPSLTLADTSADVHTTGTTAFYRPAGAGSFDVTASATDAHSGILDYSFPALAGFTSSGSGATKTYTLATPTEPDGAKSVTARNPALLISPAGTFTLTADSGAPTGGALTVNGTGASGGGTQSYDPDGSFTIGLRTDYTDGGSGIGSSTLTREDGTLSGDTCSAYGAPATLIGTPVQGPFATGCYRYVLTGTDNVGNAVSVTTVVKVDTSAPGAPSLTLADTSADVHTTGTTAFYRPAGAGSFDVTASSTDADSGIASYSFPALAGFTTSGSGASRTYTLATPTEPDGAKTVTAQNNAGGTNNSTFTLTADAAVPTGGALTVNGTAATGGGSTSTSSGSFSISRTDYTDAISGIATSTLTRDSAPFTNDGCGSYSGSPTTILGSPAQSLTTGCYEYVLTGTDAVGNTTSITTVVQVHGAATQIALTGSTANLTSGATRVLTATIRDASGNTVVSDSSTVVAFAQASGAGTVTGTGNATVASGVATKTITGALAGLVTMEATSAGLTTGTLGAFTVVVGPATQIALTGSTTNLTSGATRVLTATIQDAGGNTVTSDNTTVVAFAKQSGAGTVTGTGNDTAVAGVATKTITGALAGSVTMEATSAGLTTGTLGAFTVVHGAAAQIALTGSTADLTSGATRVLTATIQDAAGNTVTSDNTTVVAFAKASGAGTVTGTGNATASSGVATKTMTGALVGSVTMEATSAGLTTGTLGAFSVVHGAATQIALTGSTADLAAGATRVLTATIQDAAGNTVTSDNTTVVAFAKQSGAGSVTGTGTATASSGVATKTITGGLAGSVTMEATSGGLTTGTLGAFTVVAGPATQIALTGSTANLTSGATRVLTATIQDAGGNTVTSDSTTVVTFAQASGAGTVTGTGTATASSGVATKTITGAVAGSVTMEATSAGLTTGTLGAFTVVHGAAAQIALTGATADLTSGATRVLTATIQDAAGNTVTSDNTTVVAFAKASGAGTVTGTGNATAASGAATKTITGALVGSVTMEATSVGLTTGTLGAFTVVHGAAAQISLTGSTADLTSGANRVLTATIQDAAGNTVTSDNTTVVAFAKASGAGTVTDAGNDTAVAGVATKTITGALAGSVTMEATSTGLTTGTLGAFTVIHGAAAQIALTGATTDLTSGTNRVLTATIQDAAGNTVTNDNTTVVTFAKQSGAGTVSGTGNDTAVAGVASKTVTGVLAGAITLEATSGALTDGTLAFTVVHGAAAQIGLTGATSNLTSGANRVLTATIQDAAGNTVTSDNTTVVAFAKASGAGTVTGTGNDTAVAGVAAKTITGQLVGSVTMEATSGGLTTGTLSAFTVVHGAAAQIALTGATTDLTSGTNRVLTATVQDAAGNTVTNDNTTVVTFAKQSGAGTVTGTGTDTAVAGVASKTITGQLVGSVTMEATAAGLTTGTLGAFTVVHGAAAQISLTGSTADLTSGANRVLTATIQDGAGNTVTSDNTTVVAFAKQSGAGSVTGTGNDTAVAGVATKTITGALAGSVTMEATSAGLTTGTLGAFTVVHGAAAQISLTGSTADLTSGATRLLTATIQDAAGNTVTSDNSTVVAFAKASGAGTVTGAGNNTAVAGVATKTITGALAGSVTMEATSAGLTTGTLGAFTVVHGPAADIVLTGATTDLSSGANRVLTATLKDAAGNTVTSDNTTVVAFAKASGAGTVTGTGNATAASGVASKTITGAVAGSVTMEATSAGLTTGTLGAFTVVHGAAAQISLTGSTADLSSGATRVLTATIQDAAGNTVTSDNTTVVAFAKASGAGTVTGTGNATAASGAATKTITGALVGSVTMEATSVGLTTGTLGAFTVVHGAAAQIALTGATADLTSGATRVLTATIQDAAGNTVTSDNTTVVAFAKASGAGTVSGTGNDTAVAGVASKTVTGVLAGAITLEATSGALTDGTLAFTVVHGAATQIALTESGSTTAGDAHTLTATLRDANGNTVTSDNTTVVTFAKTSGAGTVTGLGSAAASAGVATKSVTNRLAGQIDLDAQAAGLTTGTASYTIVVGPVSASASTVNATPSSVLNNGTDTTAITVTVLDAGGNPLSGKTVSLDDAGATSVISPASTTSNAAGVASFTATSTAVETAVYTGTADAVVVTDTATVDFVFSDSTPPTNTITLASAGGAYLTGTTLYYRPAAAGSFTLSSAVVDGGSGPGSATYPAVGQTGWTHALETVNTPAGGPYVSSAFSWTNAASGNFGVDVEAADAWTPPNSSTTTLNVTEDSTPPTGHSVTVTGGPVFNALSIPFVLGDGSDAGAGLDTASRSVTRQVASLTSGVCGSFSDDAFSVSSPDTGVMSGNCYRYVFTIADRVGNVSATATSAAVQVDSDAPIAPTQVVTESGADGHASGSTLFYLPSGSGTFTVTATASDAQSGLDKVTFPAVGSGFVRTGSADDATAPYARDYTWSAGATASGAQTVTAQDLGTNTANGSFTLTADSTGPATAFTAPAAGAMLDSNVHAITATATDAGGAGVASVLFEVSDGGPFTPIGSADTTPPYSVGWDTSSVSDGPKTLRATATDNVGNTTVVTRNVAVDKIVGPPDTSISVQPADPNNDTTPEFAFTATETPATFECNVDGAGWASCATPFTVSPALGDGSRTFAVRATDAAGNTDPTQASYTWVVDATLPAGSLTAPGAGAAVAGSAVTVSSDSADGLSGVLNALFEVSPAAAGTWTAIGVADTSPPYSVTWDTTGLGDGDYDLRVTTRDVAGNAFVSALRTVTVDNTAPSLTVNVDTTINIASPDPETIGATATDTGTGIDYVKFEQCNSPGASCGVSDWTTLTIDTTLPYAVDWPIPTDGVRLLAVTAVDNAGRQTFETVPVTIDRTAPTTALTAPVAAANLRATAPVAASASDPAPGGVQLVEFQLTTNGGAYTDPAFASDSSSPYTGSLVTTGHADGLYDLRTFTSDVSGNSTASSRVTVRIDNTPPTGSVTAPTAGANIRGTTVALTSDSADAVVNGSASGVATVVFERSPAGAGTWTNQGPTFDTTAVTDGLYDLRVVTTDNAGNVFTSGINTVRVDNTLPTGSVTSPAAAADVRGSITLTSDSADTVVNGSASGVATVVFQRSPAGLFTWTNQAASWNTTLIPDGLVDVRVVTTDNAGNVFTSPTITIRVDNTAPTGSVTAPVAGAEIGVPPVNLTSDSADVGGSGVDTIVFERSPAGAGTWTATAASWNTASGPDSVGDGSYDLRVKTTDKAGNSFTSAVVTVLVDHTAPLTSASLAPGSPSNAPVTVSFTAGDGSGSGVSTTSYRVDGGSVLQGSSVVIGAPGDHSNDGNHVVQFFSTDDVGNVETPKTVNVLIDTTAPSGTPGNPGDYLRGIANLTYSTAATDVSSVQFQFSPASAGAWSNIGAADIAPPYEASWTTTLVADGPYDLRAVVTDSTGNVANELLPGLPKTVDNTAPSGSVTSPAAAMFVSGSVNVTASATDGAAPPASGVSAVRFEVKPSGASSFTVFGTQTAPVFGSTYQQSLATGSFADGPADLQVVVTDVAGNETTSATRTINIDNVAPTVTLDDPGTAVGASVNLTASSSGDTTDVTFRYRPVGSGGAGTLIGSDATAPFTTTWSTAPAAEQQWELIAVATDGGGNVSTSAPRVVLVDRTLPTGDVTAPASGATVGGSAVALTATAADVSGSGVAQVAWQVKLFGSGSFSAVSSDTSAPYEGAWNASGAPDGATEIRATITDAAGNVRTTAVIPVTVDSTGPSVTLTDPGAVVSGTVGLNATTGGGAVRVAFGVSPAGAGTWTEIASDTSAPFGTSFDTRTVADGLYDLRAIGYDSLGNPSSPSVRANVRFDNIAPKLISSAPGDGSVSASANQIVLTASEPVTAPGALLDGVPAPAPTVSGSTLTFATGALSDGLHVLSGELEDASGTRTPFRVAVTIESTPLADRPPVEMSAQPGGSSTLTAPSGLASATMPPAAWPSLPSASDFIVLRVDLAPPAPVVGTGLLPGTQLVEVTAHWALAGTPVTQFEAPIDVVIPNPSGKPIVPATSQDGSTWRILSQLGGATLPAGQADGWYRDGAGSVHILTRHLTWFALLRDDEAPSEPRDVAGVVADDGLTIRWIPGSDSSGQLGNVILYVNGEGYRQFGPTEYEAKLGAFAAGDTRTFTLAQVDAAGNTSRQSRALRAVPQLTGKSLEDATAALGVAGFALGRVLEEPIATVAPGTVVGPADLKLALESSAIDLVVARGVASPETKLVFSVASSKKLTVAKRTTIAARIKVSRPADVTATLYTAKKQRLYMWRLKVKAGANVVKLRLPTQIRRPGTYSLTWVARSGTETIRRTVKVTLVGPKLAQVRPKREEIEIVLAGEQPAKDALKPGLSGTGTRVVATATPDQTFALTASAARNVGVVVVDVDAYGLGFVSDLRTVFPSLRLIAIAREPATRTLAVRAGAVLALPRNTPARQLAKAIAAVAGR